MAADGEDWLSPEDPGLWADEGTTQDLRLPREDEWRWVSVVSTWKNEWNGCLVTRRIDCGIDCYMFANSFPFLPRHPSASFPCSQAESHDFLLANGMRPKWYNPLPSSVHKDQLSSLRWIFLCLPALRQCCRWPWRPCVVRGRIYHPELLNNCVKLSSQAPQTGLCMS